MSEDRWTAVDRYFGELLIPADDDQASALKASSDAGLPAISVSPLQGRFLYILARLVKARSILEIGTLGGYSTIWLARGLEPGGHLVTLEFEPKHAAVARSNVKRAGLEAAVEVQVGKALDLLPGLQAGGSSFDMIFIDADKGNYSSYLEWSLKLAHPGTLIVADNVVQDGGVADAGNHEGNVDAIRAFNEKLAALDRVTATAIQTVGVKGYDGFAMILVH